MESNTAIGFAYSLLLKGVHLDELKRFVDAASPPVDSFADTVPAPPPLENGARDPDTAITITPPPPSFTSLELLDFRNAPTELWDEVAELVECLP